LLHSTKWNKIRTSVEKSDSSGGGFARPPRVAEGWL
jgi:hypothetical protein